jgi:hypothetical protein
MEPRGRWGSLRQRTALLLGLRRAALRRRGEPWPAARAADRTSLRPSATHPPVVAVAATAGGPWDNPSDCRWQPIGGVVEWLMAPVLKTGDPQGSVGSNPTPSVC